MMFEQREGDAIQSKADTTAVGLAAVMQPDVPGLAEMRQVIVEADARRRFCFFSPLIGTSNFVFQFLLALAVGQQTTYFEERIVGDIDDVRQGEVVDEVPAPDRARLGGIPAPARPCPCT